MSSISKLFDQIYKKFVLRDIVSILFCGFVLNVAVYKIIPDDQIENLLSGLNKQSIVVYVLIVIFSYITGMLINELREAILFYCFYPKVEGKERRLFKNMKNHYEKNIEIITDPKIEEGHSILDTIERQIVMLQATGNLGITLIIVFLIILTKYNNININIILIIILILGILLGLCCRWLFWEYLTFLDKVYDELNKKKA